MKKVIFNGSLVNYDDISITDIKRGFMYGDGLFETMKWSQGEILFFNSHFSRLKFGMEIMKLEKGNLSMPLLNQSITLLAEKHQGHPLRFRMSVFRTGEGRYKTTSRSYSWLLEAEILKDQLYMVNQTGLKVKFSEKTRLSWSSFSEFKTMNSLTYILAGIEAAERQVEDLIILDPNDEVVEMISSNVFGLLDNELITPKKSSGCVEGVFKVVLKKHLPKIGIEIKEKNITTEELLACSSVYSSNVINGMQWIEKNGDHTFKK